MKKLLGKLNRTRNKIRQKIHEAQIIKKQKITTKHIK